MYTEHNFEGHSPPIMITLSWKAGGEEKRGGDMIILKAPAKWGTQLPATFKNDKKPYLSLVDFSQLKHSGMRLGGIFQ